VVELDPGMGQRRAQRLRSPVADVEWWGEVGHGEPSAGVGATGPPCGLVEAGDDRPPLVREGTGHQPGRVVEGAHDYARASMAGEAAGRSSAIWSKSASSISPCTFFSISE